MMINNLLINLLKNYFTLYSTSGMLLISHTERMAPMRKIGRYNVNETLTAKLAIEGWVIYRDPSVGLYCSPVDGVDGEEFMTGYFSAVQIKNTMYEFIMDCRITIASQKDGWDELSDEEKADAADGCSFPAGNPPEDDDELSTEDYHNASFINKYPITPADTKSYRKLAVELVRDDLINSVMGNAFTEYPTYSEFIAYTYDGSGASFKDDVYFIINQYNNEHPDMGQWFTDDLELIEANGTFVPYRAWIHDVQKMFEAYYNITYTIATAVQPSNSDLDFFDFFEKVSGALFEASAKTGKPITDAATYSLYLKNIGWSYCDPVVNGDGSPFTVHDYVETLNTAIVTTHRGLALIKDGKLLQQELMEAPTGICYCRDWDC